MTIDYKKLEEMGWRVLIIWECEIRHGDPVEAMDNLVMKIRKQQFEETYSQGDN